MVVCGNNELTPFISNPRLTAASSILVVPDTHPCPVHSHPYLTTGETMNMLERIFGAKKNVYEVIDESRPVKLVPEGRNVWRVVYAD